MSKVFIGMPVYNGEATMRQAIESLLGQSFRDITLFISNDASKDTTEKICMEYMRRDARVKYCKQEKNLGMFPNLKFVMDQADTPYFMWASHDDIWEKDFIKVCVENIEKRNVDVAQTVVADVDSYGRNLREMTEFTKFSGKPGIRQVTKYVLQPEILGKNHFMYALFKTEVVRKAWEIYPQKREWGSDYHFSLAVVSRFKVYVDSRVLFKKRHGGFSSPNSTKNDSVSSVKRIIIKDPKNHMFPYGRFDTYFKSHMEALKGTSYRPLCALLLLIRLPRAFFIHMKQRNYRKFLKKFV
ncbi:MAG: glycosyltransferase family 2 protein [bacterium]|nr:glycosyltransferase family 2 protein [bacterium]